MAVKRSKATCQDDNSRLVQRSVTGARMRTALLAGLAGYATACLTNAIVLSLSPLNATLRQSDAAGTFQPSLQTPSMSSLFVTDAFADGRRRRGNGGDDFQDLDRAQSQQQRDADRQAREMQRDAERQAREQQRDAGWQVREQQRDSERQSREQQRDAERQAREQQRDAEWQAREQQREAERDQRHDRPDDSVRPPARDDTTAQPVRSPGDWSGGHNNDNHDNGNGNGGNLNAGGSGASGNGSQNGSGAGSGGTQSEDHANSDRDAPPQIDLPPTTVKEWFDKLGTPAKPPKQAAAPAQPPAAKPPKRDKPVGGAPITIELPEFSRPRVLAVNATAKTMERAQALGFKSAGVSKLSSLNYGVTSLVAPPGMTAKDAQTLLNTEVPEATVAINQKYSIYRTATGTGVDEHVVPATVAPQGSALSCGLDRCFATDIVGWKPELRSCATGLKIGIIDTSVDVTHPAFAHKKIEVSHLGLNGKPGPDWHGTGVTSLLAGDTSSGTPGLIPNASFYVADVFRAGSDEQPASDTLSMLRAFDWLAGKDVKIINMSLSGPPDGLIAQAITKLSAKGIVFVAAAGNGGPTATPSYPAAYNEVIAVTAVGKNLKSYRYANRGSYIDVAAPGVGIWTALPGSKEGYHSGTSFAAPYVTAAIAAIYARLPNGPPGDVLSYLKYRDLGDPGPDTVYGQGLLIAPQSCGGGQLAKAKLRPVDQSAEMRAVSSVLPSVVPPAASSLGNPPSPASGEPEILPWLSLQNSSN